MFGNSLYIFVLCLRFLTGICFPKYITYYKALFEFQDTGNAFTSRIISFVFYLPRCIKVKFSMKLLYYFRLLRKSEKFEIILFQFDLGDVRGLFSHRLWFIFKKYIFPVQIFKEIRNDKDGNNSLFFVNIHLIRSYLNDAFS